jgi:hypothetical protein
MTYKIGIKRATFSKMHKLPLIIILSATLFAPAVRADLLSSLGGGTVTVTSIDADDVKVKVTLASGDVFAITGAGDSQVFLFNVDESVTLVAGSITSSFGPLGGPFTLSGSGKGGTYSNGIGCTSPAACNGTSDNLTGPLTFELNNPGGLTVNDFTKSTDGDYFAEDIGVPKTEGTGFNTGVTTSDTVTDPTPTPEPTSVVLLVSVLALTLISLRKRRLA